MMYWYSQRGVSHEQKGIVNQDSAFRMQQNGVEAIAVADGVGSCQNSEIGSRFITRLMTRYACYHFEKLVDMTNEDLKDFIITNFRKEYRSEIPVETALSTLLLVARKGIQMLVIQIGDGKIIAVDKGNSAQVFFDKCLPVNQTYTWNSNSVYFNKELFNLNITPVDYMLLCTDGVYKPERSPVDFNYGFSFLEQGFTDELYKSTTESEYNDFIKNIVTITNGHYGDYDDKTAGLMVMR